MKSSAGALGAKQLSKLCAEIESRGRNTGVEAARPLVETLDHDVAAAISSLQEIAGEMHAA